MQQSAAVVIRVDGPAPAKDGGRSIRNPAHPHSVRVQALRQAMAVAMQGRTAFEGTPVRLKMRLYRRDCGCDALNLINGVADIIQRRHHRAEHGHDVWVLEDDAQIREFSYQETPAERDSYELVITSLAGAPLPLHP